MMLKHLLAFSRHLTASVNQITALLTDCWERRGREGGRRGQSCLFVLPYKSDKINSSCSLWQKTTLWPEHTYMPAPFCPVTPTYSYPCSLGWWLVIYCLFLVGYIHAYALTASKQRSLGCLQWLVKDIKNPSITQINWANGKCDSRTAEAKGAGKGAKITGLWKHW